MKKFVFIVTNDEYHWRDMSNALKEKGISIYPETEDEFNNLRCCCESYFHSSQEYAKEAETEIKKIISQLPKNYFCLIRFQITEGDFFEKGILFFDFFEKFLINNPEIKLVVYFEYGGNCTCDDCLRQRKKQQEKALHYCNEKEIPFYYWEHKKPHFFVKKKEEFLTVEERKELSIDMLLT